MCVVILWKEGNMKKLLERGFLFSELVKRDFKKKYKNTYLGMIWSLLSPLLTLLVMNLVFSHFFGRGPHYITYLFSGNIIFAFFSDSTTGGMESLLANSQIFTRVNVPKYLFLFSRNVSSLINFGLTLVVFFIFCIFDGITFSFSFLLLIVPILCLVVFNLGVGLILSALYVFFRDTKYLWTIFCQLLMYMSAIFYQTDALPDTIRGLFYVNPIYVYIRYFRVIVIDGALPSLELNVLAVGFALVFFAIGAFIYKRCNHKFLYFV